MKAAEGPSEAANGSTVHGWDAEDAPPLRSPEAEPQEAKVGLAFEAARTMTLATLLGRSGATEGLAILLESSSDAVVSADDQGRITALNASARRLMGLAADHDPTGLHLTEFQPPAIIPSFLQEILPRARETGEWRGASVVRTREGSLVPVNQLVVAHRDRNGGALGYSTLMRPVAPPSAPRRAHDAAQPVPAAGPRPQAGALERVSPALPHALLVLDAARQAVLEANPACSNVWGRSPEALQGTPALLIDAIHVEDRTRVLAALHRAASPTIEEFRVVRPDGQIIWVRASILTVPEAPGEPERRVVVAENITDRQRAEMELLRRFERLRELEDTRALMLNTIAHDLAAPIQGIRFQLTTLGKAASRAKADETPEAAILRHTDHLHRLVQDVRDLALIEAGELRLQRETLDVGKHILASVEALAAEATRRGQRLETDVETDMWAPADPVRLMEVLHNLVSNALKFTPGGGTVRVSSRPDRERVLVRVADTGRGLTTDEVARLFRPFARVHDPKVFREKGTGLGLYICKHLVERHGGKLWVESEGLGKGATFSFSLPVT